jgi:hypothetical protein
MAIRGLGSFDEEAIAQGVGYQTFTSALVKGTDEDKAVKCATADVVTLAAADENFIGVVRTIGEGPTVLTGVQMTGWAEVDYTGSAPSIGWNYLVGGSTNGKVAVATEVAVKKQSVTVSTGQTSGSGSADPDLVGGEILGWGPDTNGDQVVDDFTLNADGSVTVTLNAAATADNKFKVAVQKPVSAWPRRFFVRSVDTTNVTCTIWLG